MPIDISFLSHFLEEEISTPEDLDIAILFYVSIFPVILLFFCLLVQSFNIFSEKNN